MIGGANITIFTKECWVLMFHILTFYFIKANLQLDVMDSRTQDRSKDTFAFYFMIPLDHHRKYLGNWKKGKIRTKGIR